MKESFRKLALPVALAASMAGCATIKPSAKPETVCPEDSKRVEGICLSTEYQTLDALGFACDDKKGELMVGNVENAQRWVCDVGNGEWIW